MAIVLIEELSPLITIRHVVHPRLQQTQSFKWILQPLQLFVVFQLTKEVQLSCFQVLLCKLRGTNFFQFMQVEAKLARMDLFFCL